MHEEASASELSISDKEKIKKYEGISEGNIKTAAAAAIAAAAVKAKVNLLLCCV